jgi:hypothetical protein
MPSYFESLAEMLHAESYALQLWLGELVKEASTQRNYERYEKLSEMYYLSKVRTARRWSKIVWHTPIEDFDF